MSILHKMLFRRVKLRIGISALLLVAPIPLGLFLNWKLEGYYQAYSIWGLICAAFNFLITYEKGIMLEKYNNTKRLIDDYNSDHLLEARDYSREYTKDSNDTTNNYVLNKISRNAEFERSVIYLFNFWEIVYRMIEYDMVDKEMTRVYFVCPFMSNYKCYQVWIDSKSSTKARDKSGIGAIHSLYKLWSLSTPEA